ncbi:PD-(D/E)XK nuclease family protein [Calidifontimicrobium sp. SYSU G02091]|uniref:PD-(D/E)XK nuclease family protein n=1 Tax=Calidifontimicrobium sp. SYSU G02091 TaxID=2926421 RepID=UPI001F53274F|nr:PD-(D/E)XK nuclease family protein [Calidifontimicrobium sp. SYSU G02091]MCI1192757.1 PD-(D/E)XK nuclease family protein [Calidifontimicrobium sp. SYSU G02091]
MPAIDLLDGTVDAEAWRAWARRMRRALDDAAVSPADAVVLLPFAELLPVARSAFAALGGWQPRVETTHTLADALGPPPARVPEAPSGDRVVDRLVAAALLRARDGSAAWARRDPRGFDHAVDAVVDAAHALMHAVAAQPPGQRHAWWQRARALLAPIEGPGRTERLLARVAVEWAALDDVQPTDRLWAARPAAWVTVAGVGGDALVSSLAAHAGAPVVDVRLVADAASGFARAASLPPPRRLVCDGFEDEAEAAAAEVLQAVQDAATPVLLVALDRALVRRVHAMLERVPGLRVHDETGWRLSTTRAAARVMALLRAAAPGADADAWLDALKADAALPASTVTAIESAWRSGRALDAGLAAAWGAQRDRLAPLSVPGRQPLRDWLRALATVLGAPAADPAAQQVAATLRLDDGDADAAWRAVVRETRLDRAGFVAWVDAALDAATFRPPAPAQPHVVITPLARALWRPFGAVVCPGCDGSRLGAAVAPDALWSDAVAAELGLETGAQLREREAVAFAQLLRAPRVVLLRRRSDAGEPLGPSPLVERAWRARRHAGTAAPPEQPARLAHRTVRPQPPARPAPRWPGPLPSRLSATAVQALRDCPYRFHARVGLGLREADELDAEVDKRDYGTWLHAVLLRFHQQRGAPRDSAADLAALASAADAAGGELGLDAARLLPYRAAFDAIAPRYVQWLHRRDADGWRWQAGEVERERAADERLPLRLGGRIDRIDDGPGGAVALIDYKTGSPVALRAAVREPLEDTQLATYAALLGERPPGRAVHAMYLALDDREAPVEIVHPDVAATAQGFIDGLAADLREIAAGAGLPALGEGAVCTHCEARGLCRRDHWSADDGDAAGAA